MPGTNEKMSVFKFHPLYDCQYIPQRTEEDRKLLDRVKKLKAEGAKIKKEKDKKKMKFQCPFFDPLTNTRCSKTYATFRYIGATQHLISCPFRDGPGNAK